MLSFFAEKEDIRLYTCFVCVHAQWWWIHTYYVLQEEGVSSSLSFSAYTSVSIYTNPPSISLHLISHAQCKV